MGKKIQQQRGEKGVRRRENNGGGFVENGLGGGGRSFIATLDLP